MKKYITLVILCFVVISKAQTAKENAVGINTPTPQATLDVNGTMKITELAEKEKNINLLSWNESSGSVNLASSTPREFNMKKYKVYLSVRAGEYNPYIGNFNTKIPAEDYIVQVSNYKIKSETYDAMGDKESFNFGYTHFFDHDGNKGNSYPYVDLFQQDGTWRVRADIPHNAKLKSISHSIKSENEFYWEIDLLIISRNYMKILGNVPSDISNALGSSEREKRENSKCIWVDAHKERKPEYLHHLPDPPNGIFNSRKNEKHFNVAEAPLPEELK